MRKGLAAFVLLGALYSPLAHAQAPVVPSYSTTGNPPFSPITPSWPLPVTLLGGGNGKSTTQVKITVAVTNTYVLALAANTARAGCAIQYIPAANTDVGYVFFGASPADTTTSFRLGDTAPEFSGMTCAIGGTGVATDSIFVTGTSGDIFIVSSQ
jgi:hypothetical protein